MRDYIKREDALECVTYDEEYTTEQIKGLPSADVVPVVRCRDCKYVQKWRSEESAKKFGQIYECVRGVFLNPHPDDFCSYGERRK